MSRWLLVVAAIGCRSPQKREPAPVATDVATATPDAAMMPAVVTMDADPFAGYPDRVARPAPSCVLRGQWNDQPEALRLTADGKPFANILGVKQAEVTFAGTAVFAELSTDSIDVGGFVDAKLVRVHAAKPFTVGDYAAPGPKLAMQLVGETGGKLAFVLPLPAFAKAKAPLRGEQPCANLAIDDDAAFDPHDAIDADVTGDGYLHAKRLIPLSLEVGKPAVVELRYAESPKVEVLDTRAKSTRVAIEINSLDPANHVVLFGWVPTSAVHHAAHGFGGSWATGGGRAATRGRPMKDTRFLACDAITPLVVELAGTRKSVGTIAPRVVIEVLPGTDADYAPIRFPKPNAELVGGARWLVKHAALTGCATVAAP